MKCTVKDFPPPSLTKDGWVEIDKITARASEALLISLSASKGSIEIGTNPVKGDVMKKGMPPRRGHEFYPADILPYEDNCTCDFCTNSADLKCF